MILHTTFLQVQLFSACKAEKLSIGHCELLSRELCHPLLWLDAQCCRRYICSLTWMLTTWWIHCYLPLSSKSDAFGTLSMSSNEIALLIEVVSIWLSSPSLSLESLSMLLVLVDTVLKLLAAIACVNYKTVCT